MSVITVRGTHGSGKSTLVRTIMAMYGSQVPVYTSGRKRPFGYMCHRAEGSSLWVLGSYETPTGGCDTIPKVDLMFDSILSEAKQGNDVLFEGILAQHSTSRLLDLNRVIPVTVHVLDVPEAVAIAGVESRRTERGDTRPLDPANVLKEARSVRSSTTRLKDAGVKVVVFKDRGEALRATVAALGLPAPDVHNYPTQPGETGRVVDIVGEV